MGYSTDFSGQFDVTPPLTAEHVKHLQDFNADRHCEPEMPSFYCQWVPAEDGTAIEWDGGEKFYNYIEWLAYLVKNFFQSKGYTLSGTVSWQGEDSDDFGLIEVNDNKIVTREGIKSYGDARQEN
jgi:hypothetical protein